MFSTGMAHCTEVFLIYSEISDENTCFRCNLKLKVCSQLQYHLAMSNLLRPDARTYNQIKMGKQSGEMPLVQTANLPKIMSLPTFKNDSLPVIYKRNVEQPKLGYLHKPTHPCNSPLTVFVKTARYSKNHSAKSNREAIREYAKYMRPKNDINLYFLIGHDDKGHVLDGDLKMEAARNGDIIVGDFEGN